MQRTLPVIAVNGVIDAQISPLDRGFNYGDGVFETCKLWNAHIPLWNLHKERLLSSCHRLLIPVDIDQVEAHLAQLLTSIGATTEAVVKITVTRGAGGRGYAIPAQVKPTVVIGIFPAPFYAPSHFSEGVRVILCRQRLACNPALAGLKHLNRLEQILARCEWQDDSTAEGLMQDTEGHVIEAVFSNIFLVKNNLLITPDLSRSGVAGVMRRLLIETLAPQENIRVCIQACNLSDVIAADEVFLSNSLYGIWPIKEIVSEQQFGVGPVTSRLQSALRKHFH